MRAMSTDLSTAPVCLSISAITSSGAEMAQADLKTFTALGTYGVITPTAVTASSFTSHDNLHAIPEALLRESLDNVDVSLSVRAVKIGMVPTAGLIRIIGRWLRKHKGIKVVVDPVLTNQFGIPHQTPEVVSAMQQELLPQATVITPNRFEAAQLTNMDEVLVREDMESAAQKLFQTYGCPTVVTGGGLGDDSLDVFCGFDGISHFTLPVVKNNYRVVGVGCTYAAAITAQLARAESLRESIQAGKSYARELMANAHRVNSGDGNDIRPACHFLAVNSLAQGDGVGISASGEFPAV